MQDPEGGFSGGQRVPSVNEEDMVIDAIDNDSDIKDIFENRYSKVAIVKNPTGGSGGHQGFRVGSTNSDLSSMSDPKGEPSAHAIHSTNQKEENHSVNYECVMDDAGGNIYKSSSRDEWQVVPNEADDVKSTVSMSCNESCSKKGESSDEFDFSSDDEDDYFDKNESSTSPNQGPSIVKELDLELLQNCMAKGEESLRNIEGEDVVLVVGKTGTGKSTLIQGIAGKSFVKSSFSCDHIGWNGSANKDVFNAEDAVPGFDIGHAKSSMTKQIRCYLRDAGDNGTVGKEGNSVSKADCPSRLYYLDTPGFEDTEAEEVDIATSAMLGQVARKCRSMRFVILVHYVSLLEDRGGAMRSILKFIRKFVTDFQSNKKSFMFLFSHADEIRNVPEYLPEARQSLLNEIRLTINGTSSCDDAMRLLVFIRKCLEKKFLYVDILHPLKTDFSATAKFIEGKLKPINTIRSGETNQMPCALTNSSQMKLNGAVRKLLLELKYVLGQNRVNVDRICEIQNIFMFFQKYVYYHDMRSAIIECNDIIEGYTKHLRKILEQEVRMGTSMSSDSLFNDMNVAKIENALFHLERIDSSNFDIHAARNRLTAEVTKFQAEIVRSLNGARESTANLYGFQQNLQQLHAWCTLGSTYEKMFSHVVSHATAIVKKVTCDVSDFTVSQVFSSSITTCEVREVFVSLRALNVILENLRGLSTFIEGIDDASRTYNEFIVQLRGYLETMNHNLPTSSQINFWDMHVIQNLATQVESLAGVMKLIEEVNLQDSKLDLVMYVRSSIETRVVDDFAEACTDWGGHYLSSDKAHSYERLSILRNILSLFVKAEGERWKEMEFSYNVEIDKVKSLLKSKSGELLEMSHNALEHGVTCGERAGGALNSFALQCRFDEFLPQEECFVQLHVTKIRKDYVNRFSVLEESVEHIISHLTSRGENIARTESFHGAKELQELMMEIIQCARFASVTRDQQLQDRTADVFRDVHNYIHDRANCWRDALKKWTSLVSDNSREWDELTASTEVLNLTIGEINDVVEIPTQEGQKGMESMSLLIKDEIMSKLSDFKQEVEQSLNSQQKISYSDFAVILARGEALGDFRFIAPCVPNFEQLKQAARQRISREAEKIEEMIEQTSEYDVIDGLIKDLEEAVVLDKFVCHEVTSRLRPLKRLREDKEVDSDRIITSMIEKNDFSGLGEFLQPLSQSKNQIRQIKFKKSIERISESLTEIESKVENEIIESMTEERGRRIASYLLTLEQAYDEAGEHLSKSRIEDYKNRLDQRVAEFQEKMKSSIEKVDFVGFTHQRIQVAFVSRHLGKYLTETSERQTKKIVDDFETLKASIPSRIDHFTNSSWSDAHAIEKILTKLEPTTKLDDPVFSELSQLYVSSTTILAEQVESLIRQVQKTAEDTKCYDDSIELLNNFLRSLRMGMKIHLPQTLQEESAVLLGKWVQAREKQESEMDLEGNSIDDMVDKWARILDDNAPSSKTWNMFFWRRQTSRTYDRFTTKLAEKVKQRYKRGFEALERRNFDILSESLQTLSLVKSKAGNHIQVAAQKLQDLEKECTRSFLLLCHNAGDALRSSCREFVPFFDDFRGFVINVTFLMRDTESQRAFHLTNQLVYERLSDEITSLEKVLDDFDFLVIKQKIDDLRIFGGFVADRYSLFHEELKAFSYVPIDKWLDKLKRLISRHFQNGRDLQRIKYFSILGIVPSASQKEISSAYRKKCRLYHPDKSKNRKEEFLAVQNAYDELQGKDISGKDRLLQPFDDEARGIEDKLICATRKGLEEQDYDHVGMILFKLYGIEVMENLVSPKLQSDKIRNDVMALVKNHARKVRFDVDVNWSERRYQEMNQNMNDLRMMQEKLNSYKDIFSSSWNVRIIQEVESEIDRMGAKTQCFLKDRKQADSGRNDFRRYFMMMGAVLVELPMFKHYTKKVMSDVLETCLHSNWGYSYVFDLGLSLQKGGETDDEDEVRIAQTLVSEFGHFKDVLTMVWNEETVQKPPEETVREIFGQHIGRAMKARSVELNIEKLLEQYLEFESLYASFLGEYLHPGADLNVLVHKTIACCHHLKPASCDNGFGPKTTRALPKIMAGIFALFTVLKSGESYNRIEEDANGCAIDPKMLLMKPHNIQVLTLLCMFGCGESKSTGLKSQLMQIRTGEGKSMILGAAAVILGLLGFRVKCVCYSEYLSNRDYELFHDVFIHFGLLSSIKYCKITTLSEDTIRAKGDIRDLTLSLLYHKLPRKKCTRPTVECSDIDISKQTESDSISARMKNERDVHPEKKECAEEIMLFDEVDVFFGKEFYGNTYNMSLGLSETEVVTILNRVWEAHKRDEERLCLADIKSMTAYQTLLQKFPTYGYLIDHEIDGMLYDVRYVDDEPFYYLDHGADRIGYKRHDTVCYSTSYRYRTVFAYMKEAEKGNLKNPNYILPREQKMFISCGKFSYAHISPKRILGLSGTLDVMNNYEKCVLKKYGIHECLYIPSVYGRSNFKFDRAGDGVSIEKGIGDFFHSITQEILKVATKNKRAVIVFFKDSNRLNEYTSSSLYRKLGRKKEILTHEKNAEEKAFTISKAATTGQITLSTAIFGRGTDFFCKDERLENNGGVHVIQTFLSADTSEEIQIQGRTARQGKQGSYKLILMDQDLEDDFNIKLGSSDNWAKEDFFKNLCIARDQLLEKKHDTMESNLADAKKKDNVSRKYFDALLDGNDKEANNLLKDVSLQ